MTCPLSSDHQLGQSCLACTAERQSVTSSVVRNSGGRSDGVPTPLDGRPLVAIQNGIVQGGGAALFTSNAALDAIPMNPAEFPPDCQAAGLAGSPLTVSFVLMYNDGSLLSLTTGPGACFCTDGTVFTVAGEGAVTGGEKRFAGATGTFSATAESSPPRVLAELDIDLD